MKSTDQDEQVLYYLIGKAISKLQILEDCLSHMIVLKRDVKKPFSMPQKKADEFLEKYLTYTLGDIIKLTEKKDICTEALIQDLNDLKSERNWLVHKCIIQNRNDMLSETSKHKLFQKICDITNKTETVIQIIEADLIAFSSSNGLDMTGVQAAIQKSLKEDYS